MAEKITNASVEEFLQDFENRSETFLLEEGKEKDDILEVATAKGYNLKNSHDLAGFKTIFTFANQANKNKARLPQEKLLKVLPGIIGKPVDIDHIRNYVVGHYIDYRYRAAENMVIAYGVFYKSNFGDEWITAQKLFKAGTLATSYEIWCPKDKRKMLSDGTYELTEMEIAGGGLMFKEKPAFEKATVLELASDCNRMFEVVKQRIMESAAELVCASLKTYDVKDIVISNKLKSVEVKTIEDTLTVSSENGGDKIMSETPIEAQATVVEVVPVVPVVNAEVIPEVVSTVEVAPVIPVVESVVVPVVEAPVIASVEEVIPTPVIAEIVLDEAKKKMTVQCAGCKKDLQDSSVGNIVCPNCGKKINGETGDVCEDSQVKASEEEIVSIVPVDVIVEAPIVEPVTEPATEALIVIDTKAIEVTLTAEDVAKLLAAGEPVQASISGFNLMIQVAGQNIEELTTMLKNGGPVVSSVKELNMAKDENNSLKERILLLETSAVKILERRNVLGTHGQNLSEKDILDDDKFEVARLKKENAELKIQANKGSGHVSEPELERSSEDFARQRKLITEKAYAKGKK